MHVANSDFNGMFVEKQLLFVSSNSDGNILIYKQKCAKIGVFDIACFSGLTSDSVKFHCNLDKLMIHSFDGADK